MNEVPEISHQDRDTALRHEDQENKKSGGGIGGFLYSVLSFVKFIIIVLLIVIPVRMYVAQPFIVRGESMYPTFENADYLIIDEFTYQFLRKADRGEVIVFRYPKDPSTFFIKRIVGTPGDTVIIRNGSVFITHGEENFEDPFHFIGQVVPDGRWTLGENEYFVMGDNREFSSDSRIWGVLTEDLIIGRSLIRLWPLSGISILPGVENTK